MSFCHIYLKSPKQIAKGLLCAHYQRLYSQASFSFYFLLRPLTVLMKQTRQAVRAVQQSILLRCIWLLFNKLALVNLNQISMVQKPQWSSYFMPVAKAVKCQRQQPIDVREYMDCSLARPASLVLVEQLCHRPLLRCGTTFRCKTKFLLQCLLHNFKFKL